VFAHRFHAEFNAAAPLAPFLLATPDYDAGQPCPQTSGLYFHIAVIGYYRCEHF
jgi:hypothetical protein